MRRIALDYTPAIQQSGGIGRRTREITAAVALPDPHTDFRLFVAGASRASLPAPPASNFSYANTPISPRWLDRLWHRARIPLPVEAFTGRIDLFHATDFVLPPVLPATRTLLTVHDLSFLRVPDTAIPALRDYLKAVVPRSVARADHILATSIATQHDLQALYDCPASKITVLYSGVDSCFQPIHDPAKLAAVQQKYGLQGKDFLLSVGTLQPRKNYSRVIRALETLAREGIVLHYAIAGGRGWMEAELHDSIARSGLQGRVQLLGLVDDADLPALYCSARLFIMPSLYEGFGLPLLEAMACGCPVITSNCSSLPEVVGDAGILVDPQDTAGIARAIARLVQDKPLHRRFRAAGLQRVTGFTWAKSAAQLLEIYAQLLTE